MRIVAQIIVISLNLLKNDNIDDLRAIVAELSMIQIGGGAESDLLDVANILRG